MKSKITREQLLKLHDKASAMAKAIMVPKNQDYGANDDPFRNFRSFEELGILVRLSDKLARLRTFLERGEFSVKDETVVDTALDAMNYLVLFLGYLIDTGQLDAATFGIAEHRETVRLPTIDWDRP